MSTSPADYKRLSPEVKAALTEALRIALAQGTSQIELSHLEAACLRVRAEKQETP